MNLQLLPCLLNSVPLAKSARFLDHASSSTASWAGGYLDELCKSATLDTSHLTVPSTFPAWLPSSLCCSPSPLTFRARVQPWYLEFLRICSIGVDECYVHVTA